MVAAEAMVAISLELQFLISPRAPRLPFFLTQNRNIDIIKFSKTWTKWQSKWEKIDILPTHGEKTAVFFLLEMLILVFISNSSSA